MYVGRDFDPSDVAANPENELYTLDFVNDLVSGETMASATWFCTAVMGTDAGAQSHVTGAATMSGTQTSQRISGLLAGVKYQLKAVITTSNGNTKSLWSHVWARNPD